MSATSPRGLWGSFRREINLREPILAILAQGPRTIPEVVEALGGEFPSYEVVHWMMAMRRYGRITEVGEENDEGYYQYAMVQKDGASDPHEEG